MLSCAKIVILLMFLWRIFQSLTRIRVNFSTKIWWKFMWFFLQIRPPVQIYDQSNEKNLIG